MPRLGFAPGYALVDARGDVVSSEDMRGSIVLYGFTIPRAEDPHRDSNRVMAEVRDRFADHDDEIPVRLVSIVLATDSIAEAEGAMMASGRTSADGERWRIVSGRPDQLLTLVRDGFGAWYDHGPSGGIRYDPTFVVVDGLGIKRSRYRVRMPDADVLARDVRSILREAGAASGAACIAYEAAYLFQCYPSR